MKSLSEFWQSSRLRWVIILAGFSAAYIRFGGTEIFRQQFSVLMWKLVLVSVAVGVAHYFRTSIFPYVDMSELAKENDSRSGLIFLAMAIFYVGILMAICGGL